jgi:hypothetical protein
VLKRNVSTILKDISVEKYNAPHFSFEYPKGGAVIEFERGGSEPHWRLLANLDGIEFYYDIHMMKAEVSAEQTARALYENASSASLPEDVPPYPVLLDSLKGWRYRYRFVDGVSAPLVIEALVLDQIVGGYLCRIQYVAAPEQYEKGLVIYEFLLRTFKLM